MARLLRGVALACAVACASPAYAATNGTKTPALPSYPLAIYTQTGVAKDSPTVVVSWLDADGVAHFDWPKLCALTVTGKLPAKITLQDEGSLIQRLLVAAYGKCPKTK